MSNSANPSPEPQAGTADEEPSVDDLFDVLTDVRRRHVLTILAGRDASMAVDALARTVAGRVHDADPASLDESRIRDVHVALHHVHLPKLDEVGLVDYDRDDGAVETTGTADAVPIEIE